MSDQEKNESKYTLEDKPIPNITLDSITGQKEFSPEDQLDQLAAHFAGDPQTISKP